MPHLLISGTPSVGKTTLVREVINPYRDRIGGFVTLEIRNDQGQRMGFEVMSLPDGKKAKFAGKDISSQVKFNKYGLDLEALDSIATASIEKSLDESDIKIVVIDEIGVMEAQSAKFREVALRALNGGKPVLATIRSKSQPFTDEIKEISNLTLVELTRSNYPNIRELTERWVKNWIN